MDEIESSSIGITYGLAVRLGLLPTPSLDDAVASGYGQPVLCPKGTFTPPSVCAFRRTIQSRWDCRLAAVHAPRVAVRHAFAQSRAGSAFVSTLFGTDKASSCSAYAILHEQ